MVNQAVLVVLCLIQGAFFCQASSGCPKFKLESLSGWRFPGQTISHTITISLCASTTVPINFKVKLPFNNTASMRLIDCTVNVNSSLVLTGSTKVNMTSSENDGILDEADVNLGQVTSTAGGDVTIKCLSQVLSTPSNGLSNWVSAGVEYTNGSVWVAQISFQSFVHWDPKPALILTSSVVQGETEEVLSGSRLDVRVNVSHDVIKTRSAAHDVMVSLSTPSFLTFVSMTPAAGSASAQLVSGAGGIAKIKIPQLNFTQEGIFNVTYNIDPSKAPADDKIHIGAVYVLVKFCCPNSNKSLDIKSIEPFKFYVPHASCDAALGMASGSITNDMISASSYSSDGLPRQGRLNNRPKAWIPRQSLKQNKNQYLQVNFTSVMKIRRLAVQGDTDANKTGGFVKSFMVYYSDDCGVWNPVKEGGQYKVFRGNNNRKKTAMVLLTPVLEAKCIRINPIEWNKEINLRVELYGCSSSSTPPAESNKFVSRSFLLDTTTGAFYTCNIRMKRKVGETSCLLTKDSGASWADIDFRVMNIEFLDPSTKTFYGLGTDGARFACLSDLNSACAVVTNREYDRVKGTAGNIFARAAGHLSLTDSVADPAAEDSLSLTNGKKWGATGQGISYNNGATWTRKVTWTCDE